MSAVRFSPFVLLMVGLVCDGSSSREDFSDDDVPLFDPAENSGYFEGDIMEDLTYRSYLKEDKYMWPKGIIPYIISHDYDKRGRDLIARARKRFHNKTCIRFVKRRVERDFIYIKPDGGCSSFVGRRGGQQTVSLDKSCYSVGVILHEFMHTLGFVHEQNREDRDGFLSVVWDNIKDGHQFNFKKMKWYRMNDLNETYDYSSVLHYSRFAFSKVPLKNPTIRPKKTAIIGQRKDFSKGDLRKINKLYDCKKFL